MAPERAPAFQFYPSDFISGEKVARMSYTEVGIYIVLLSHAWLAKGLPTNVTEIAKMLKVNPQRFARLWCGVLSECWVEDGGRLVNPRQEVERQKQADYRGQQSARGKASAASRRKQPHVNAGSTGVPTGRQPEANSSSSSSSSTPVQRPSGASRAREGPTLVTPPKAFANVAHFSPLGDVPVQLHSEFARKVANGGADEGEAERQVRAFYADVERRFAGQTVGAKPMDFWRERFTEACGPAISKTTSQSARGAQEFIHGSR